MEMRWIGGGGVLAAIVIIAVLNNGGQINAFSVPRRQSCCFDCRRELYLTSSTSTRTPSSSFPPLLLTASRTLSSSSRQQHGAFSSSCGGVTTTTTTTTRLRFSRNEDSNNKEYSTEVRLREEAEAPFRKVRFLLYSALLVGCFISLLVSGARIAAGLNGINVDLLDESLTNAGIDVGGIALLGFLLKSDLDAQESRLQRASKGAELASLLVRGKAPFFSKDLGGVQYTDLTLSSFRAGRGIDKRVVILAAGEDKISEIIEELKSSRSLKDSLIQNDLFVIPVVVPNNTNNNNCAPPTNVDEELLKEECIGLPVVARTAGGGGWRQFIQDEIKEATKQGVDVKNDGFALILKKNGRVGQRTSGFNLSRMVGEVEDREGMGMDVTNI